MNKIFGWVQDAQTGNRYALNQLIDYYQTDIFRLVYYRIHNRADAEDLTQDIFVQVIKRIRTLKDQKQFKPWLYRIALNRVRDYFRKKRLLFFMGTTSDIETDSNLEFAENESPETEVFKKEFQQLLKSLSTDFSKWEREIFLLRYIDDMNLKEIAIALNKSESTVKTHLYRALEKFKKHQTIREFLQASKR